MRYQSETYVRKHVLRKHKEKLSDYAPVASKAVALASSNASTITTSGFSVVSSCTQVESTNKVPVRRCSTSLRSHTNHGGHFKDHKRVHTNEKPFACHMCAYRSNVKSNVNKHLLIKHGVNAKGGDQDENLVEGEMTEEELVGNAAAMITSTLLEAKEACDMVAEVAAASTIRAHIILNEDVINSLFEEDNTNKHAVYRCRICLYTSLKKNNIENHVITHTDLQAFKCQLCPYKSNFKKDLVDHCNLNHQVTSAS
ncbi:hypothetical protein HAZT_HAZT004256 [Hyalella azteca]|uniref:C2H2-type domain-containing protein n=1 Tax=Hyalella azteca TaxID=294128 RepID=A0A6A0GSL1_HYAAZ|nr:hypothetical protein HAZT_HAZT004256 [Hyalella azteca]